MCEAYYHWRSSWEIVKLCIRLQQLDGKVLDLLHGVHLGGDITMYVSLTHAEIVKFRGQNKLRRGVTM